MIKRTLYFGNPAYLSLENNQLQIKRREVPSVTAPIEDIGLIVLDNSQITISQPLLVKLLENNVALITCDARHHPIGTLLTLDGNTLQTQRHKAQVEASQPLKKQLWQQTITTKINNQAKVMGMHSEAEARHLYNIAKTVKSGDSGNAEARAAVYYWPRIFPEETGFSREDFGRSPNAALNYGYAILRALVARALVGSGLIPTLGIFHRNQYNAFCLADDIMEPYRPAVDLLILKLLGKSYELSFLNTDTKTQLLKIPTLDVKIDGQTSPLMNAVTKTTASLVKCFEKTERKLKYPEIIL